MTLIKRHSVFPFFPSSFDDEFTRKFMHWPGTMMHKNSIPAVNIHESENEFSIEIAAPGMKKEDFNVEFKNNILSISATKETSEEQDNLKGEYSRREFNYSTFRRSFSLPEKLVDFTKASGKYEDGILSIHIPKKKEEPEKVTKLEIK